jgi:hypothetical protein
MAEATLLLKQDFEEAKKLWLLFFGERKDKCVHFASVELLKLLGSIFEEAKNIWKLLGKNQDKFVIVSSLLE